MQETSALYKQIIATEPHWFETQIKIKKANGTEGEINENQIFSLDRSRPGMNQNYPSIGGALASTLSTTILKPSYAIPKTGQIKVYIRAVADSGTTRLESEWIPAGTYFVDTRANNQSNIDTLDITAFDAMMFAEADYPNTTHDWPYLDRSVVAEIAAQIGVTVDSRTNTFLRSGYMIDLPINYVMREVLEHIAAMYCGNFVVTAENKLLFVPLMGLDPEENIVGNYLAEEGTSNALTFGTEGWYILV